MSNPRVVISVLNWMNYSDTINCIKSLQQIDYDNYEIVVVDNNSRNDSIEKIGQAFPQLKLIQHPTNDGYAAGHKSTVEYAQEIGADLIWILNNDLQVRENALTELINCYRKYGDAIYGSVSLKSENPDVIDFGGGREVENGKWISEYNIYEGSLLEDYRKKTTDRVVSTVEGSSMLVPISIIKSHGFMDESFFMYGEETEYCYRLAKRNIPVYVVINSHILHKARASFMNNNIDFIYSYYKTRNAFRLLKAYESYGNIDLIKKMDGIVSFIKVFVKYPLMIDKKRKQAYQQHYFKYVGALHCMLNVQGKYLKPEDYIVIGH